MILTFSSECHCIKCKGNLTDRERLRAYLNTSMVTQPVPSEVCLLRKMRVNQMNSVGQILLTALGSSRLMSLLLTLEMLWASVSILIITGCL